MKKINDKILNDIIIHNNTLSLKNKVKSLGYERCAELPFIIERLKPLFDKKLNYLDIGSGGESPLPTYFLKNTNWHITIIDKFSWVQKQNKYAKKLYGDEYETRFHVIEDDFIKNELPENNFDIITNISVIEHFEKDTDVLAIQKSGRLLKPQGIYLLTTPVNEGYYREIYVDKDVYGEKATNISVFYQRHYDLNNINKRIIEPSKLKEVNRVYFGDYEKNFFEDTLQFPPILKPFKVFYTVNMKKYATKHLSYRETPLSRKDMNINTSSGVILEMTK